MQPKQDDKIRWNTRYSAGSHSDSIPDEFLVSAFEKFLAAEPPGRALDVAGGAGRNALWLAERGWRVKLIDVSDVAVHLADQRARELTAGSMTTEVRDVSARPDFGDEQFELIIVFYFLDRQLCPALIRALKPGGFLLYRTYTVEQRRFGAGPSDARYLLEPEELRNAFGGFEILHYRETVTDKATEELVARKAVFLKSRTE
jgi:tellurite methyltransferase